MHFLALTDERGRLIWISAARPGRTHDAAARPPRQDRRALEGRRSRRAGRPRLHRRGQAR
ncbi:hypothetical protein [Streptomyces sp. NPDC014727]|uniref:hypothetical protein n=1 Tax=Streptomyces sp. NPDC014727 TaxID=3364883 RepID=UPI0036F9358F